jgi:hypothetical protein
MALWIHVVVYFKAMALHQGTNVASFMLLYKTLISL